MTSQKSKVVLHNLASYIGQGGRELARFSIRLLLQCLSGISGASYRYFSNHSEAYRKKIEEEKSRTFYVMDVNGVRRKIVCPPSKKVPRRHS